jgi:hypothetical protein
MAIMAALHGCPAGILAAAALPLDWDSAGLRESKRNQSGPPNTASAGSGRAFGGKIFADSNPLPDSDRPCLWWAIPGTHDPVGRMNRSKSTERFMKRRLVQKNVQHAPAGRIENLRFPCCR